jgi:PAS domain S-box-containing protein
MEYGMVMASKDGKVVYWDDSASELFGYAQADVVGRPVDVIVPGDLRGEALGGLPSGHGRRRTAA